MLRAGGRVLTAAIAIATATAIPVVTQVTPGGGQPQPEGTARLIGRVVAADDGRPVRRAYPDPLRTADLSAECRSQPRFRFRLSTPRNERRWQVRVHRPSRRFVRHPRPTAERVRDALAAERSAAHRR